MKIKKFIISGLLAVSVVGCGVFSGCSDQNETSSSTPPIIDQTIENTVEEEIGMSGIVLMSAQITTDEYETYGVSENALKAYTLTATYAPTYVSNALVDWGVSFVDPDSEWATGKTVTDYITVTPETDGALLAVVACFAAFEEDIQVTVMSRTNPDVFANCLCVYIPTASTNPDTGETGGSTGTTNPDTGETGGSTGTTNPDTGETGGSTEGSEDVQTISNEDLQKFVVNMTDSGSPWYDFGNGVTVTFLSWDEGSTQLPDISNDEYTRFYGSQQLVFTAVDPFYIQRIEIIVNGLQSGVNVTCDVGTITLEQNTSTDTTSIFIDFVGDYPQTVRVTFLDEVEVCDVNVTLFE